MKTANRSELYGCTENEESQGLNTKFAFCRDSCLCSKTSFTHRLLRLLPKNWIYFRIMPDLFHIVILVKVGKERIELENLFRIIYIYHIGRSVFEPITLDIESLSFEELYHPHQIRSLRGNPHFFIAIAVVQEFIVTGSGFYNPFFRLIHRMNTQRGLYIPMVFERKRGYGTGFSEISSILRKSVSHILRSPVLVVGQSLHDNCHSSWRIPFIDNLRNLRTVFVRSGSFLDGTLDIIGWHICLAGFFESVIQCRIHRRITSGTCCDSNEFCMYSEHLPTSIIGECFFGSNNGSSSHRRKREKSISYIRGSIWIQGKKSNLLGTFPIAPLFL